MTRKQQYEFMEGMVAEFIQEAQLIEKVKETEDWGGDELRVYMADCFKQYANMSLIIQKPKSKRARDYKIAFSKSQNNSYNSHKGR